MKLSGWKEKLYRNYLGLVFNRYRVNHYLHSILPDRYPERPSIKGKVRVAALQVEVALYKNPFDYIAAMHTLLEKAVHQGARMVAFPEYNNLSLLGILPGIEEEVGKSAKNEVLPSLGDITLADIFAYLSPLLQPLLELIYARFAYIYQIYIMAGSFILADDYQSVVNRAFLFDPDGKLVGMQDKINLTPLEESFKMSRGHEVRVFATEAGKIAMPICMDATYFETFRLIERKGAHIVILPIANMEKYNHWLALRGIWPRVQESIIYGLKSALVGNLNGYIFSGRAGIYAPLELTPLKDGILAEAETVDRSAVVTAELDLDKLIALRANHPWRDSNRDLYSRYFPQIYR